MDRLHYLFTGLALTPSTMRAILRQIDPENHDAKLDPDRFNLKESICHLIDWEPIMRWRIESCVERSGSEVPNIDEEQRAIEQDYMSWDLDDALVTWDIERAKTIQYLKSLTAEQWEGHVFHPQRGRMTAHDWAVTILGHDVYHLEQASQYLP